MEKCVLQPVPPAYHNGYEVYPASLYCITHNRPVDPTTGKCYSIGLGDTVAYYLKMIGITPKTWNQMNTHRVIGGQCPILVKIPPEELGCACKARQSLLNHWFPYQPLRKLWSKWKNGV